MFLQRYNPWRKTKGDQLQLNVLIFDPQKTNVDEHIDLINTLGDMLGQTDKSKIEKFIDTIPTIIQTHFITCKTWAKTTKKAKELEHIIRICDPLAAALPNLIKGTAVPGLYSHIAHSDDKEEMDIPQPFKGAWPKQPKTRGGGKGKQPQQKLKTPPVQVQKTNITMMMVIITTTMPIIEVNLEDVGLTEGKIQVEFLEVKLCEVEVNAIKIHTKANTKTTVIKVIITKVIEVHIITHAETSNRVIIMANLEAEVMVVAEEITMAVVTAGPIIEVMLTTNTISIIVMMMSTIQINMVHHVHYVVV